MFRERNASASPGEPEVEKDAEIPGRGPRGLVARSAACCHLATTALRVARHGHAQGVVHAEDGGARRAAARHHVELAADPERGVVAAEPSALVPRDDLAAEPTLQPQLPLERDLVAAADL